MANLNTKTISAGVGDILAVDGGIHASTVRQIKDGDGTGSPFYITTTKVGIGTDAPGKNLTVVGTTNISGTASLGLADNAGARLHLLGSNSNQNWMIANQQNGAWFEITPSTSTGGSTFTTPALVILNDGKVGIGITNPTSLLHLDASGTSELFIDRSGAGVRNNLAFGTAGTIDWYLGEPDTDLWGNANDFFIGTDHSTPLFVIQDAGNVGIGTDDPDNLLHIEGSGGSTYLRIVDIDSDAGDSAGILLSTTANYGKTLIAHVEDTGSAGSHSRGALVFALDAVADTNDVALTDEKMRITYDGSVGIGITAPDASLDIACADGGTGLKVEHPVSGNALLSVAEADGFGVLTLKNSNGSTGVILNSGSDEDNYFAGNVGIGTTAPDKQLHVHQSSGSEIGLTTTDTDIVDGDDLGHIYFGANDPSYDSGWSYGALIRAEASDEWNVNNANDSPAELQFFTQSDNTGNGMSTPNMVIDSDGNVGIGTSTPSELLEISGATNPALEITDTTNTVRTQLNSYDSWGNVGTVSAHDFSIMTAGARKLTIVNSTGNVGIGENAPNVKLYVSTDSASSNIAHFINGGNNTNRYGIKISAGLNTLGTDNDATWIHLADGDATNVAVIEYKHSGVTAEFTSSSDERLKENIVDTKVDGLESINALKFREFNWTENSNRGQSPIKLGLVAQEVPEDKDISSIVSNMAKYECKDGTVLEDMKGIGWNGLIPYMAKAIQELSAKVEALENA